MPTWTKIRDKKLTYSRELGHITGNNKILKTYFNCDIQKTRKEEMIKIWDVKFKVKTYEENCRGDSVKFKNVYHVDTQGIVRRSFQHHSDTVGSILIERLDR